MALRYLPSYLKERFAPINMMLFAILFLTVISVCGFQRGDLVTPGWVEAWGALAVISFFFRLRVFDEIKDYQLDLINHPQRVLQSGKISLKELSILAALLMVLELAWSVYMGLDVLILWAAAVGYSLLMRVEFFVGTWLKKRLTLYAITHMLIMPVIIAWIYRAYHPTLDEGYLLLAALSLLAGFSFEIARKTHAAEAERELVDSYSKSIGYRTSVIAILILLGIGTAVQYYLLHHLQARLWPFILLGILYLGTAVLYLRNLMRPQEKSLRQAELVVSLFMLFSYLSVIIEAYV